MHTFPNSYDHAKEKHMILHYALRAINFIYFLLLLLIFSKYLPHIVLYKLNFSCLKLWIKPVLHHWTTAYNAKDLCFVDYLKVNNVFTFSWLLQFVTNSQKYFIILSYSTSNLRESFTINNKGSLFIGMKRPPLMLWWSVSSGNIGSCKHSYLV